MEMQEILSDMETLEEMKTGILENVPTLKDLERDILRDDFLNWLEPDTRHTQQKPPQIDAE